MSNTLKEASNSRPSQLPLTGIRVVDLSRLLPGGYASLVLMELGAEVIKVEEIHGGDGVRTMFSGAASSSAQGQNEAGAHVVLSRGKKSLAIDLKQPRGQVALGQLIANSHVLLDSFRPGVLDRLGLSESRLAQLNPNLVHISLTAFGAESRLRNEPTHDMNAQGYAGSLGLVADVNGQPVVPGVQIADVAAGLQAVVAALAGLRNTEMQLPETGSLGSATDSEPGFRAQVTMADSALSMLMLPAAHVATTGSSPNPAGVFTGMLASYRMYECSDSEWITVGGLEPKFFSNMLKLIDKPELVNLQYDFDRQDELRTELEQVFASETRSYWVALLGLADTCVGPVYSIAEALADNDAKVRGGVRLARYRDGQEVIVPAAAHWLDPELQPEKSVVAPLLGEDSIAVLVAAGLAPAEVESLIEAGIVRPAV